MSPLRPILLVALLVACGSDSNGPATPPPAPPPPGPPTAATLAVHAGNQQKASPSAIMPIVPAVVARNAQGAPVAGVEVHFAVEAGGGTIVAASALTGADGVAIAGEWKLGPLPGENRLRASAGTLAAVLTATAELRVPTTIVTGSVALPGGSLLLPGTLTVVTGLSDVPVSEAGSYTLAVEPGAPQLAAVHAANGEPVLFGWVDGTPRVLGIRSTAEVLAYFDLAAGLLPDSAHRRQVREMLSTQAALGALEAALTQALAAAPAGVTLLTPAVIQARKAVVAGLAAAASRGGPARSILLQPSGEQSGVTVDQTGYRQLTITNNWRRRVWAFVDRVGYTPHGAAAEIPHPLPGAPIRLDGVTSATSIVSTVVDLLFGNFAWVPVVAPPQSIPLAPVNAKQTRYRVVVVGGGLKDDGIPLSGLQVTHRDWALAESILLDLLIPLTDQMLSADNVSRYLNGTPELDTAIHKLLDLNPVGLFTAVRAGDWSGFWNELMKLIFDSGAGQAFFVETILVPHAATKGLGAIKNVSAVVKRWSNALAVVEILATTADVAWVLRGLMDADQAEEWDVVVQGATVTLTPPSATIFTNESPNIQAFVLEATGGTAPTPAFLYRWTTTGQAGKLCVSQTTQGGNFCGLTFDSPRDIVAFNPVGLAGGTDQVKVEVFLLEGTTYHAVGEKTMTITVRAPQVYLAPVNQSVAPGQTANITGSVDALLQDGGIITYRWRTPGAFGSFGGGALDIESTQATVGYVASPSLQGTDPIALDVYSTKDGIKRHVGSASGSVEVSRAPTIVLGSWFISSPVALDAGRSCVGAYLTFPLVADAKSYEVHAYGFNDTATGRTEIRETLTPPFTPFVGCSLSTGWGQDGQAGNAYQLFLSGAAGPASAIANAVSSFQSRFAGMTVEVTVRY